MWLTNSSIGKKVIMSVTGIVLILFLTFHACMNVVALISADAYDKICEFLGANWYAVVGTAVLAAFIALHFIYAFILTLQNSKARGNNSYAVTSKPAKVEWASQNMFVLGIIVVLGLGLHLYNFWAKMMLPELMYPGDPMIEVTAGKGSAFIAQTFGCWIYSALYIVWLVALWFHLSHGFWSALQTIGINGKVWFNRWRTIGNVWVTIVTLMFIAVVVAYAAHLV